MKEFKLKAIRYTLIVTAIIGIMIIPAEDSQRWAASYASAMAVTAAAWWLSQRPALWQEKKNRQRNSINKR